MAIVARLFESLMPPALRGAGGLARALLALPFAAAIALIFGQQLFRFWKALGLGMLSPQGVSFIQKQYDFLLNCRYLLNVFDIAACKSKMIGQLNPFDFALFEMFVWIALALVILRVVTGAVTLPSLDQYSDLLRRGWTISGVLASFVFLGLIGIFVATNLYNFVDQLPVRLLVEHSPRGFLALQAFMFCAASASSAEGILFIMWAVLRGNKVLPPATNSAGN
ncbi:hypothetical protein [Bradyrhizobium sp. STM 3562]|uniref:hypothetical protein n=1 Tax=Bradyrhizobium sp. STM 3562 TaxID=578924 RepID=UPI00388EA618